MKKAQYLEELQLIGLGLQPDRTTKKWDNQTYMNQYQEEIEDDDMFNEAKDIKQLPNTEKITIQVITKETWVYWVTEDKVEYKGTEEDLEPELPPIEDAEPTYICVGIKDGVLSYYNNKENAMANNPDKLYENVNEMEFMVNWNGSINTIPWKNENIERVVIEDEIAPLSTAYYFCGLTNVKEIEKIENLKTNNATSMLKMFFNCTNLESIDLSGFSTKNVETMDSMFANCASLKEIKVSRFDTSKVTNMNGMFQGCASLTNLDLSKFDTSQVTQMAYMFQDTNALTSINLSNFDTSNVTRMDSMFANCSKLTNLNLSNFNTRNVTTMEDMFYDCRSLTILDISNFNTNKVTNMTGMFNGCNGLTMLDVSNFDTSNVTNMSFMFCVCSGLTQLDLSNFDTRKVTDMSYMFQYSSKLTTIYNGANWKTATTNTDMFDGCGTSTLTKK